MRIGGVFALGATNLSRNKGSHAMAAAVSTVGVASLTFFLALGQGVKQEIIEPMMRSTETELEIRPGTLALGPLLLDRPALLGGGELDDSMVKRLEQIQGVKSVHPVMNVKFPVMAYGRFFKRGVRTDLVVNGVDKTLIEKDLGKQGIFDWSEGKQVPVVVSPSLLTLYNASFAEMHGLPKVTSKLILGFEFHLALGRSYLAGNPNPSLVRDVNCKLVGFSRHAVLLGATVPLEFVRKMNKLYAGDEAASTYSSAVIVLDDPGKAQSVQKSVEEMGLKVSFRSKELLKRMDTAFTVSTTLLSFIGVAFLLISALVTSLTLSLQVSERKSELGLFRALGATKSDIVAMMMFEAAVVGLVSGVFGVAVAAAGSWIVDSAVAEFMQGLASHPSGVFAFPWWLVFVGLVSAPAGACLGAILPAGRAAGLDPAAALSSGN